MDWQEPSPSDEVDAADWVGERLHPFAQHDVGSIVPTGFDAYARVFHPAWKQEEGDEIAVRWSEVAAWNGRTVHPEMQFHSIAVPAPGLQTGPQTWSGEPRLGVLSNQQTKALIGLLTKQTSNPDACWFCVWEGYGFFNPGAIREWRAYSGPLRRVRYLLWRLQLRLPKPKPKLPTRKRVQLPQRNYLLFRASIAQALGHRDGPNLWWPDDRSWCVASEIDLPYTYVGGPRKLIEEILAHPDLEALPATIYQSVTADSDKINSGSWSR